MSKKDQAEDVSSIVSATNDRFMKQLTEEQLLKRDFTTATWVGEEGGMAVGGWFTKEQAIAKMKRLVVRDCGREELDLDYKKAIANDIGKAGFRLTTEEEKPQYDESEWIVTMKPGDYKNDVWAFFP